MAESSKARKRSENWEADEKLHLLDAIKENVRDIEDRRNDCGLNRRKSAAWKQVHTRLVCWKIWRNEKCQTIERAVEANESDCQEEFFSV